MKISAAFILLNAVLYGAAASYFGLAVVLPILAAQFLTMFRVLCHD